MAENDCGFCLDLFNCGAQVSDSLTFYTFASKMLCEIANNTGGMGPTENMNISAVGGIPVTIEDFQESNLTMIANETLGASFYDQALQAIQVSVVASTGTNDVNLIQIAGETLGAAFYDQTLDAIQVVSFGNIASDAADAGNPVKIGYRARTSDITSVANNDRVDAIADKAGKLVTMPYALPENEVKGSQSADMTGTASTSVIAAVASKKLYITTLTVSNMSATIATRVDIQDGSGGTVIWSGPAAAAGGGFSASFPKPISTTSGNGLFAVNATTGAAVRVSAAGYSGD